MEIVFFTEENQEKRNDTEAETTTDKFSKYIDFSSILKDNYKLFVLL